MRQRPLFLRTINHLLLVTHLLYASLFNGTPEPPSSRPKALRSMVMGCMGVSYGSFCACDIYKNGEIGLMTRLIRPSALRSMVV